MMDETFNINELTTFLHDSYQTMKDRMKRTEHKVKFL